MDAEREIEKLQDRVARIEELAISYQLRAIKEDVEELKDAFDDRRKERERERKEAADDKRTEFKWRIGTALVTVGLIVSAMAVLLSVLGGAGA